MAIIGELAALCAAFSYAASSTIFSLSVKSSTPILMNFLRGTVSIFVLYIILVFFSDRLLPEDSARNYILLIISGIIGIGIGDCFYFQALNLLGARKTILLETLAPPFTGLISYFYYGTTLPFIGWMGIFITAYGIHTVVNEQAGNNDNNNTNQNTTGNNLDIELETQLVQSNSQLDTKLTSQQIHDDNKKQLEIKEERKKQIIGISCGVAFTACQAFGMILSHDAARSKLFSATQSSLLRIMSGVLTCAVIIVFKKDEKFVWPYSNMQENKLFFLACLLGPIFGIWSQQTSLIYTRPEIAQTILATTPLFGLAISWFRGEQMKPRYLIGSLIAIAGVCIIIWS